MTNRIPLIVNVGDGQIQELPLGDNLDIGGGQIVNVSGVDFNTISVSGSVIGGNLITTGNLSAGLVISDLIPDGNSVYSLGNASNQWKELWVSNSTIYIDGYPLSIDGNAELTFNSNVIVTENSGITDVQTLSATGGVIASYFTGDGGNVSNVQYSNVTGANANVAAFLANFGSNSISTSGGVIATSLTGTIVRGTSNLAITSNNGNVAVAVGGTANIALFTTSGTQLTSLGVGVAATGNAGEVVASSTVTAGYSDRRLKSVSGKIESPMKKLSAIDGVIYRQNAVAESFGFTDDREQVGVLAQQIAEVLPQAVTLAPFDRDSNGSSASGEHYLTVWYERLIPLLIESIKELNGRVEALESKRRLKKQ